MLSLCNIRRLLKFPKGTFHTSKTRTASTRTDEANAEKVLTDVPLSFVAGVGVIYYNCFYFCRLLIKFSSLTEEKLLVGWVSYRIIISVLCISAF